MNENRVVLIDGSGSEWYEKAIFILKSPKTAKTKNLVFEAEKIINDYMLSGNITSQRIERYKKSIAERAQNAQSTRSLQDNRTRREQPKNALGEPARRAVKKTSKTRYDFTAFLINICLVMCSLLLGYLMRMVMK